VTTGAGISGTSLGGAFGVQTGMGKLSSLETPLGGELRILETLRGKLRKRGTKEERFGGEEAELERERLTSKPLDDIHVMF
jgi:hypothetical protein